MKSKTNLLILLLAALSITFSSCKKELGCMDVTAMNYNPDAQKDDASCVYSQGCMDINAMNYDQEAQRDDASCVYSHNLAQGMWNMNPDCEELSVLGQTIALNDQLPDSINIQGDGNTTLFIDIDGTVVTGEIDFSGNITVDEQTISIDPGLGVPLDVLIVGDGAVYLDSTGVMNLTYTFEIPIVGTQNIDCHITINK